MKPIILFYLIIINSLSMMVMYKDKQASRSRKWRIQESRMFLLAILGGAMGIFSGMHAFRHKTKHIKFVVGIPLLLVLNILTLYTVLSYI